MAAATHTIIAELRRFVNCFFEKTGDKTAKKRGSPVLCRFAAGRGGASPGRAPDRSAGGALERRLHVRFDGIHHFGGLFEVFHQHIPHRAAAAAAPAGHAIHCRPSSK